MPDRSMKVGTPHDQPAYACRSYRQLLGGAKGIAQGGGTAGRWMSRFKVRVNPKTGSLAIEEMDRHCWRDLPVPIWRFMPEVAATTLNRVASFAAATASASVGDTALALGCRVDQQSRGAAQLSSVSSTSPAFTTRLDAACVRDRAHLFIRITAKGRMRRSLRAPLCNMVSRRSQPSQYLLASRYVAQGCYILADNWMP